MCKEYCSCILALGFAQWVFFFMVFGDMANGNHGVEPKIVELCILLQPGEEQVCFCFYYFCFFCFILFFFILATSWGFCHFFQGSNYFLMYHIRIQCYRMDGFRATSQLPMRQPSAGGTDCHGQCWCIAFDI